MTVTRLPKFAALVAALIVLGAVFGAYRWSHRETLTDRYRTETIARGPITQTVAANGTLNPVTLVNVGTQVSGTVKRLFVDYNDHVKKGQILLELDTSILSAQERQSEANLANARASLILAQANAVRMRSLFKQQYVSQQELDQAEQQLRSARAQVELAQAQLARDKANLGYAVIRSPVSGVVVDRLIDVGQTVAASFQTPTLFKIAQDLSKMQIDSSFAEADIGQIHVGQVARFTVDAFPNRTFEGTVKQVRLNPTIQQNVVTYDVVIAVNNPDQVLLPGMTAYVNVITSHRPDALLVPNAALRFKPAGENAQPPPPAPHVADAYSGVVYVLRDNRLQPVSLALGITDNKHTEVLAGDLKVGDRVVTGEKPGQGRSSGVRVRMF